MLGARTVRDRRAGIRISRGECGKSGTTFLILAQREQGEAKLEHPFRRALRIGILL